ncbi:hypothetical protein QBC37DRAFT_373482 [Rhypophila decipiens]|uniref:Uncharacterized protein n=1 Tax=Rhypophila decipiens TaxID=261697 RepID=A0AAN6Y798_9PEZI|nr:hypothetical protein QBC37DRAFT_373482 [Rhypophila decipiens]
MADSEGATSWFYRVPLAVPGSSTLTTSDTTFGDTLGGFSQPATQDLYDDDASQTTFEDALTHISDSTLPRISIESIDHLNSADPESAAQNDNDNPQPDTILPGPGPPQIQRLKTLNIRSSVHLSADESPEFSRQENNALEQFIYIISITDNQSNPPKSLGTYICIKGLLRERQLRIFHNTVSRRGVRNYFAPLRVCYDTRLIRYAASEEASTEPALPKSVETNCGQLLRTRREDGSEHLTTIGGLITFGDQCYIMTSSDHHQDSSDTDSTDTDSVDSDTTDEDSRNEWESASPVTTFGDEDYDDDIEPPLILGLKDDGHQPESVPGSNKLGGIPPAPHVSGIIEIDTPGILGQNSDNSHWRLILVSSDRLIPNRISIPTEIFGAPVISGNINGHRECDDLGPGTSVAINAGVTGITAGKVTGKPSYLVTNGRLQRVWTIALPPGTNLQRGDSGSWVLDQSLSVLGAVLAISDGYVYLVSIDEQLAQITEVLRQSQEADSVLHTKAEIPSMTTFLRCLAAMHTDSEENSTKNGPQTDSGVSFCSRDRLQLWEAS